MEAQAGMRLQTGIARARNDAKWRLDMKEAVWLFVESRSGIGEPVLGLRVEQEPAA